MHLAMVCATQNSLSPAREEFHLGFMYGGWVRPCVKVLYKRVAIPGNRVPMDPDSFFPNCTVTRVVYSTSNGTRSLYNENPPSIALRTSELASESTEVKGIQCLDIKHRGACEWKSALCFHYFALPKCWYSSTRTQRPQTVRTSHEGFTQSTDRNKKYQQIHQ